MTSKFIGSFRGRTVTVGLASLVTLATLNVQAYASFGPAEKWSDWICVREEVCSTGDFNGDGRDDVIAFVRDTQTGAGRGDVWVALSNGTSFGPAEKWSDWICVGEAVCAVGHFDWSWRGDDAIAFVRDTQTGAGRGDVWVALSNSASFGLAEKWSDFMCIGQQVCAVGDFNGDGQDDVVAFVRDTRSGTGRGDVWVALSALHDPAAPR
jgi:hypothetical protein